jgi:hypothetical protein
MEWDKMEMDLKELDFDDENWFHLARNEVQRRALVKAV